MCERFPNPEAVLSAHEEDLEQIGSKFGLKRRLKTIVHIVQYIDSKDIYPTDAEELISLYGIGHYAAAAYI